MNTENNKLIAEFMGCTTVDRPKGKKYVMVGLPTGSPVELYPIDFKYHTSWEWLMPVVEKIEKQVSVFEINISIIEGNNTILIHPNFKNTFGEIKVSSNYKMEAVYNACINFINWYNVNK